MNKYPSASGAKGPKIFEPFVVKEGGVAPAPTLKGDEKREQKPIPKAITVPNMDRWGGFVRKWKRYETKEGIPYWSQIEYIRCLCPEISAVVQRKQCGMIRCSSSV